MCVCPVTLWGKYLKYLSLWENLVIPMRKTTYKSFKIMFYLLLLFYVKIKNVFCDRFRVRGYINSFYSIKSLSMESPNKT